MSNTESNIRGIYRWDYGYSGHTTYFVSTREEVKRCGREIEIETSKHSMETVSTDVSLVTEDQEFIDKFLGLHLQGNSPLDYIEEEDEDSEFEESEE